MATDAGLATPSWAAWFVGLYRRFAEATYTEVTLRASGEGPGLEDYLALRRHTITALPTIALLERALPEHRVLDDLRDVTAGIIAWANDIASAKRELAEGSENLVGVLAREHGCDLPEAAARARLMLARRMDDFDAATGDSGRIAVLRRSGTARWRGRGRRTATRRARCRQRRARHHGAGAAPGGRGGRHGHCGRPVR